MGKLEIIQHRATKFILKSDELYDVRLIKKVLERHFLFYVHFFMYYYCDALDLLFS